METRCCWPPGKLIWGKCFSPALQAQGLEHLLQPLLVHLPSVHQNRQGDILRYIEHGDQIVKLVNESHLPAGRKMAS